MVLPQNQDETMMSKVEAKLNEVGVTIPDAPTPAINQQPDSGDITDGFAAKPRREYDEQSRSKTE